MDKKKILEIAKKNAVSIGCGVVALVAIIFSFVPLGGMFEGLQTQMETSRDAHEKLKRLNSQRFDWPKLDLNNPEASALLDEADRMAFPTRQAIAAGKKLVTDLKGQSTQLMTQAIKLNRKEPLVRGALPRYNGTAASAFKNQYYVKLDDFRTRMNATTTVTQAEVEMERQRIWAADWDNRIIRVGGQVRDPQQQATVDAEFNEKVVPFIADDLRMRRANEATMYIADPNIHQAMADRLAALGGGGGFGAGTVRPPTANFATGGAGGMGTAITGEAGFSLDYHPNIPARTNSALPDVADIWAAQIGLWIQEDVVNAIVQTNNPNRGAVSIHDAVVKRLARIDIPKEYITRNGRAPMVGAITGQGNRGFGGRGQPTVEETPAEDTSPSAALARDYTLTPTGRVCNSVYDVVHFNVRVDVDPRRYESFIANLTNNRFITILRADLKAIDRDEALLNGFVYTSSPVVQLDLKCEAIFFREWTLPLMPAEIKKLLNIAPPAGTVAGGF